MKTEFSNFGVKYIHMMEFDYHRSSTSIKDHLQVKYTAILTFLKTFQQTKNRLCSKSWSLDFHSFHQPPNRTHRTLEYILWSMILLQLKACYKNTGFGRVLMSSYLPMLHFSSLRESMLNVPS